MSLPSSVKSSSGLVAAQPVLQQLQVVGLGHVDGYLVGPEGALNGVAVHFLGAGPALGERRTIMGQVGRLSSPVVRALAWMRLISRTAQSRAEAMVWCICLGSSPSTKQGSQPQPRKKLSSSLWDRREKMVGLWILNPFRWRMGEHGAVADGVEELVGVPGGGQGAGFGLAVAHHTGGDEVGLSSTAPKAWARE